MRGATPRVCALWLVTVLAACAGGDPGPTEEEGFEPHERSLDRDYADTDDGFHPQTPGCVIEMSSGCGAEITPPYHRRDRCESDTELREYRGVEGWWFGDCPANTCCDGWDSSVVDCRDECGDEYGECTGNHAAPGCNDTAAKCECTPWLLLDQDGGSDPLVPSCLTAHVPTVPACQGALDHVAYLDSCVNDTVLRERVVVTNLFNPPVVCGQPLHSFYTKQNRDCQILCGSAGRCRLADAEPECGGEGVFGFLAAQAAVCCGGSCGACPSGSTASSSTSSTSTSSTGGSGATSSSSTSTSSAGGSGGSSSSSSTGGGSDSCAGNCGTNAGDCWCDSACVTYGDCCGDACSVCGHCGS